MLGSGFFALRAETTAKLQLERNEQEGIVMPGE
jgi:hypothetical protein